MIETKKNRTMEHLDRTAYFLLCLILFDCMVMGGGSYVKVLGIDIRMIYFALFFLTSLPSVIQNRKALFRNPYVMILVLWGIWLIFSTVRGFLRGNRADLIVAGLIGFASFGLLPGAVTVISSKERVLGLMKVAMVSSVLVAVQSLVALAVYNWDIDAFIKLNDWMIFKEFGGCTGVDDSVVRVMFRSHPLSVFGCVCTLYFAVQEQSRKKWAYCGFMAVSLLSLLISYTRSIYLCVIVSSAVLVVLMMIKMDRTCVKRMWQRIGSAVLMFMVVLLACDLFFGGAFLNYGIYRTTGFNLQDEVETILHVSDDVPGHTEETASIETTKEPTKKPAPDHDKPDHDNDSHGSVVDINQWSDDYRQKTVEELFVRIGENPIIGSGMGAVLSVRENMDNANEYFYLDQVFKTGIIGVILYMAPMLLMLLKLIGNLRSMEPGDFAMRTVWLAGLLGIAVFCMLNPYLNGSNGIALYCCTIGVMSIKSTNSGFACTQNI